MVTVTIDTHILIRGLDGDEDERHVLANLQQMHTQRRIDIAISNRIIQDKAKDKDDAQRERHLMAARQFSEISSPFRVNLLQPHGIIVRDSFALLLHNLFTIRQSNPRKNTLWDIDHLYGHYTAQRDCFLTKECRI
jgi:hypothetical protein